MNRCPACGTTYTDETRFCPKDGSRILLVGGAVSPTAPPSTPAPPSGFPDLQGRTDLFESPVRSPTPLGAPLVPPVPVRPSPAQLAGQVLDARYRLERRVGAGGMSFVYLATDLRGGERVAIKVLSGALASDANAMARLRREAELGMRLAHPNVCHIIALGETADGLVYVVMPFVDGELLADRTHRLKQLPLADTVRFVEQIAAGLDLAHGLGIVHRDLKPENVMICPGSDGERAVVMDFGLAKERTVGPEVKKLTATGIILGTPEFMSPEQVRGKPLDARSDVYALALMTFEMLTGTLPFAGKTQQETLLARLRNQPTPIRTARPELDFSEGIEQALLKGMARDPDERHRTASEFAQALAQATRPRFFGRIFG